ncbi:echinoderm microtubule-associated protein-like CG42247 [Limulus polyphemus]|uniref:Echinoderm microtubule-associated protein-like CG42247 n=1 Tax=Limulus polyphemus TaxID=6850 RepID=A0ABM1SSS7_LIMPO|nr:echinoderm microtubule-associated protein-like CG42247 [Limulus polyphemus]
MVGGLPNIGGMDGDRYRGMSSRVRKARMITFYKNGDPFHSGTKVSITPGKDFKSLENLCDFLTQRTKIPHGARFIFTLNGKRVYDLEELQDGQSYVVSGSRNFQELAYGQAARMRTAHTAYRPNAVPLREDDLRLLRPVDQQKKKSSEVSSGSQSLPASLPGSREGRVITVVNRKDQNIHNRVLLNMRTPQPFEEVLVDLGQAIKMKHAKRMFTLWGQEVRSFSQLRKDYGEIETFYLDNGDTRIRPVSKVIKSSKSVESLETVPRLRSTKSVRLLRYDSVPNLDENKWGKGDFTQNGIAKPIRRKINGIKTDSQELSRWSPPNYSRPEKELKLEWAHGIRSQEGIGNLHVLPSRELLYPVATVAVIYDRQNNRQRHFTNHTEDIQCITVHNEYEIIATGQGAGPTNASQAHVLIWRADSLQTIAEVGSGQIESSGLFDLAFSPEGSLLAMLEASEDHELWLWDWQNDSVLGRASTQSEEVKGVTFHPSEEDLVVTFGTQHLAFWKRGRDGFLDKRSINPTGQSAKTVTCVQFLPDGSMVTGDSGGYLTLWSPGDDDDPCTFIIVKEVKGHERDVRGLLLLPEGTLFSGGSGDREGHIKVWSTTNKLTRVAATNLPRGAGGVEALCMQYPSPDGTFYVATNRNQVYEGSTQRKFRPLICGHARGVKAVTSDPKGDGFYTGGEDKSVCKWHFHILEWRVSVEAECLSLAIHNEALVVAVGMSNGHVTLLNSQNGLIVSTVTMTNSALNALTYSPDGEMLAAGGQDGNMYIYQSRDHGYVLRKGGTIKGRQPILSIDWSFDGKQLQTVTSDNEFQELVLWDVHNLERQGSPRGTKDLEWYDLTSTLGHNLLGMWENEDLREVVNLTSHRASSKQLIAAGDQEGFVRLFRYPCPSTKAAFREYKHGSSGTTVVKFLRGDRNLVSAGGSDGAILVWRLVAAGH